MQTTVLLPQLELTMESVQVAGWLVAVGDAVGAGQSIVEIETQKSVVEVPCPVAGTIRRLCVAKGDTIGEKAPLCVVTSTADEVLEDAATGAAPVASPGAGAPAPEPAQPPPPAESGGIRAAPAARKLAAELGLDLASIAGTGPGGRISLDDVKRAAGVP
jgi:pyruvate/2-oxoglutarate dehydrogenase complex dihydrolipoamide acyltransferase (E2) component